MKSIVVLLGLALLLVAVQARHYTDRIENEKRSEDDTSDNVEPRGGQQRHRRKRGQMYYGYDYAPPNPYPYAYYPERREYDRNQELIPQIWRLLDEISAYVRRPPPPPTLPQPIYVPYPYPVPQNCTCNVQMIPDIKGRLPVLEDTNQNWGIAGNTNEQADYEDDGSDGSRPISFDPIKPQKPMQRPQPEVDHGSNQATNIKEERVPATPKGTGTCNAAILTCCSEKYKQQQRACFTGLGCAMTFSRGNGCSKDSINAAIESFGLAYSPNS